MSADDPETKTEGEEPRPIAAPNPNRRRVIRWVLAVGVLLLLGVGWYVAQRSGRDLDDGFVAFRPDESQFPAAPVADAHTEFGVGRPNGWPTNREHCPYQVSDAFFGTDFNTGWNSVRHDWVEGGESKAWFISERTYAYRDLADFDHDVPALLEVTKYCGWQYDGFYAGFNSILIELDGLPDGTIAFTVGVAHQGDGYDYRFNDSDPRDFQALGAFIPGPKRGQVMNVFWTGWGTDVPETEFVATVNTLYDAANRAPKPSAADDDTTIEFDFVSFDAEQAGLLPDLGGGEAAYGLDILLSEQRCDRTALGGEAPWDDADRGQYAPGGADNRLRTVGFEVGRWRERSRYLEAKGQISPPPAYRCIGSYQAPSMLIETIDVPGLPEGTTVLRWNDEGAYTMVLSDDDKQLIMVVTWREKSGPVPEAHLVDVVNQAWDRFQTDNP